jgi:hypothetical protein
MKKTSLFILVLFVANIAFAQGKKIVWDYPVKPGTEEWKKLASNEEKVNACQIPENVLSNISTEDLLELTLKYPLLNDIHAFNNINDGISKLLQDFNGIRELFKRKNIAENILQQYDFKIQTISLVEREVTLIEKGEFIVSISTLEVLLASLDLQNDISKNIQKNILQSLTLGYENKSKLSEYFQGIGFRTNIYSRAHLLIRLEEEIFNELSQKEVDNALSYGAVNDTSIAIINKKTYQQILKK